MQKIKLTWHTEKRCVDDLVPYDKNPRKINDKQLSDLKRSLRKFDLVEIPAIDIDDKVIAGHQRLKALQLLGRGGETIEVRVPNRKLTKEEFEQYLITSNAVGGDWDPEKLKSFDLDMLISAGFDQDELGSLWKDVFETEEDGFDVSTEVAKIKKPETKLGDMFQLGTHRLICGDSTDPVVINRLMGGDKADMVYSDPVYNINVDYGSGIGGRKNYGGDVNDRRSDKEYESFLRGSLQSALTVASEDAHIFYWCDESYIWLLQKLYRELGITNRRVCLWIKNGQNPTPAIAFNKCYEPCVYGTLGSPKITKGVDNLNEVMNKETGTGNKLIDDITDLMNIWLMKRLGGNQYEHATSKPPTLHEKAIRRCTRPGDIILDSFLGSGSTLVAAEQLRRRCFGAELEPVFCDLIIRRYERLTKTKAKKIT